MTAILKTVSGRTAVVPGHVDLDTVIGLDADGRIVVHEDWMRDHAFGLTLCCSAFDKGMEHGVGCRACYSLDEAGAYLSADGAGGFVGLDPTLTLTTKEPTPMPEPTTVTEVPFPAGIGTPEVGMVVEFEQFYMNRPSDKPFLNRPFRITKVNPKSVMVEDENGQVVKTAAFMLKATDRPFTKSEVELPTLGTLVRLRGRDTTLYTVIDVKLGKFKVAKVGGDSGRFRYNVTPQQMVVVDPAEVLR